MVFSSVFAVIFAITDYGGGGGGGQPFSSVFAVVFVLIDFGSKILFSLSFFRRSL